MRIVTQAIVPRWPEDHDLTRNLLTVRQQHLHLLPRGDVVAGIKLRLDLMKGIGPFSTRKEAEAAEKAVAEALERRGHRVFWG